MAKEIEENIALLIPAVESTINAVLNTLTLMAQGGKQPPVFQLTKTERELLSSFTVEQLALLISMLARIAEDLVNAILEKAGAMVKAVE